MPATVCILTPAYNVGRFLGEAIESVQAQSYRDWTMVIVDDGSKDDTAAVAERYAAKDDRIRVYRQENQGISAARNAALSHVPADSKYLFNLDADDLLEPHALEPLIAYLEPRPNVGAVFCGATIINAAGVRQGLRKTHRFRLWCGLPLPLKREGAVPFFNFYCGYGVGPFALLRRSAVSRAGEYNTALFSCEDVDLFVRMAFHCELHQLNQTLYLYRWHGNNTSSYNDRNQSAMEVFEDQWSRWTPRSAVEARLMDEARRFRRDWHPLILKGKFGAAALRNAIKARQLPGALRAALRFATLGVSVGGQAVRSAFGVGATEDTKPLASA